MQRTADRFCIRDGFSRTVKTDPKDPPCCRRPVGAGAPHRSPPPPHRDLNNPAPPPRHHPTPHPPTPFVSCQAPALPPKVTTPHNKPLTRQPTPTVAAAARLHK